MSATPIAQGRERGLSPAAAIFLAFTAALSLLVSHYRMMWFDEFLMLNTDSVSSLRELMHVQSRLPISLDPIGYHVFSWAAIRVFGMNAFAIRLPALLGFLLMEVCLYLFVRRIAGERAGLFAMVFPSLLYAQYFAVDGRPYGLLLGLYALALLCWQSAVRRQSGRGAVLLTLAVAFAITMNLHYFAPLLLIPLFAAELFRTVQRRRFDLPVVAALCAGAMGVLGILPFMQGAAVYREHYIAPNVDKNFLLVCYRTLLVYPDGNGGMGRTLYLAALVVVIFYAVYQLLRHRVPGMQKSEWVLLLTLTAVPIFGYLLAVFVTHSVFTRYVIGATPGLVMLVAIALAPVLTSKWVTRAIFALMLLIVLAHGVQHTKEERARRQMRMAQLVLPRDIKTALLRSPGGLLYIQDLETFFFARYYEPDVDVRGRVTYCGSEAQEMNLLRLDTNWLQGSHVSQFTDARLVPYDAIVAQPGEHIFVNLHNNYQWLDKALANSHAQVRYLGPAFGSLKPKFDGDFIAVNFPQN